MKVKIFHKIAYKFIYIYIPSVRLLDRENLKVFLETEIHLQTIRMCI